MRVFLVDDHPLFLEALATTVRGLRDDIDVVTFASATALRTGLDGARPDLVLLDLGLPDTGGMTALLALREVWPTIPVAVVSARDDLETMQAVRACGAAGFISKAAGIAELSAAIDALLTAETWFPALQPDRGSATLTAMQGRILHGVQRGLMNKQIAWELGLSEHTVKFHMTGILRKLGCQSRAQLLARSRDGTAS